MQDLSGTQIDRYVVQEEIGQGGMARVYRAHHPGLERDVALKVLRPERTGDEAGVARFLREARAAASLDHPAIVPIYDTGQDNGSYFIAMKYLQGQTLRALLATRQLERSEVGDYLTQIASALDYAHARGIVHRDIKPENIMVDEHGAVTLTDFGIANTMDDVSVTTTGKMVGTPVYMAPEQLRGEPASPRSDIYALGILAYELLTGATPFAGRAPYAVMLAQIDEQPAPMHLRRNDVSEALSAVVGRALAKDPAARYATAGAFARSFVGTPSTAEPLQAAAFPTANVAANDAATTTTRIGGPVYAGAWAGARTQVSARVASDRRVFGRRFPWWAFLAGPLVVLGALIAGVNALAGPDESPAGTNNPAILPAGDTPTADSSPTATTESEVVVPVVETESTPTAVEQAPSPTVTVDAQPSPTIAVEVVPTATAVAEEQPAEIAQPEDDGPGVGPPADNPGRGPEERDDKPNKDKPDKEQKHGDKEQKKDKGTDD